jgi:hypothetical protein
VGHVGVPHEFLHSADIVTALEQMRGETVSERVAGGPTVDPARSIACFICRCTESS